MEVILIIRFALPKSLNQVSSTEELHENTFDWP
jgi:hypothetical protein